MEERERLGQQCRLGARILWQELRDVWGHVAHRLPGDDASKGFVLSYVRVGEWPHDPDEVMVFDYDGNVLEGKREIPNEIKLHTEIFKARPDVNSVIHAHPHMAVALSMAGKTIHAISQQSVRYGHGVPVFPGDFITSNESARELATTLGDSRAVLMKGHGAVVIGVNVPDAVQNMLYLEQAAKQQIWAGCLGEPELFEERLWPLRVGSGREYHLWHQLEWEAGERERLNS
jgi:L-fuculose-phosphate aldolase